MAKANLLDLPVTKGTFELEGKLFNVGGQNTFKVNDKGNWRTVNLGVRVNDGEVAFFSVKGGQKKTVWLSKRGEKKDGKSAKPETKEVSWETRLKESKGGWSPMGVSMGLEKDEDGKNILTSKTEWDAYDYLKEHAVDGMDVYVAGEIEFSTYTNKEGEVAHYRNLVAKKIYLKNKPIEFNVDYKTVAQFTQKAIFKGTHKEGETLMLDVAILGWHSYEEVSFETTQTFIDALKANKLKINNSLTLIGKISNSQSVVEEVSNVWGEDTSVKHATSSGKISMIITGADGNSVENELYKGKLLEEYVSAVEAEKAEKANKSEAFASQTGGTKDWGEKGVKTEEVEGWDED